MDMIVFFAVKMLLYFSVKFHEIISRLARQNVLCLINGLKIEKKETNCLCFAIFYWKLFHVRSNVITKVWIVISETVYSGL
jgi:hypothetical protein